MSCDVTAGTTCASPDFSNVWIWIICCVVSSIILLGIVWIYNKLMSWWKMLEDDDETWLVLGVFLMMNKHPKYKVSYDIFPPTIKKLIEENNLRDKFVN